MTENMLARTKLAEVEQTMASLAQVRDGLRHALDCPTPDIMRCEHFRLRLNEVYPG